VVGDPVPLRAARAGHAAVGHAPLHGHRGLGPAVARVGRAPARAPVRRARVAAAAAAHVVQLVDAGEAVRAGAHQRAIERAEPVAVRRLEALVRGLLAVRGEVALGALLIEVGDADALAGDDRAVRPVRAGRRARHGADLGRAHLGAHARRAVVARAAGAPHLAAGAAIAAAGARCRGARRRAPAAGPWLDDLAALGAG